LAARKAKGSPTPRAPTTAPTIAFVTTCKGRLHHLKQTLPLMVAQKPDELIVVDYDCQDGTGDWVEANFPEVNVVRASQPDGGFNVSRARNLGAATARSDWLLFVDADIKLDPKFVETMRPVLTQGHYYQPVPKNTGGGGNYGTFLCSAADFAAIEGYDEVFEGWGREDKDVYVRLQRLGVTKTFYPPALVKVIEHDDSERHLHAEMRDKLQNEAVNACYLEAKVKISALRGGKGNLPLADRQKLMGQIRALVGKWYQAGARQPLPVRFVVAADGGLWLTSKIRIRSEIAVTVFLEPPGTYATKGGAKRQAGGTGRGTG
jgi:hypothetical protein